jgi:hypothetical protein
MVLTMPILPREVPLQEPIALENALFCVECEVIFTGPSCCPYCTGESVWPLAEWLWPARPRLPQEPAPGEREEPRLPPLRLLTLKDDMPVTLSR